MKLLVGSDVRIRCSQSSLTAGNTAPYPFWYEQFVPIEVMAEYDTFYVVKVLPHTKPGFSFGQAWPYTVTIDKFDLDTNVMIVD